MTAGIPATTIFISTTAAPSPAREPGNSGPQWTATPSRTPVRSGNVGSLDPEAARASARELLAGLDVADERLAEGYEGSAIPALEERFAEARRKLEAPSR